MVGTDLHAVLVQDPLAVAMLGDLSAHQGRAASFVYRWFTDPASRQIYPREDLAPQSRSFVADLRATVGRRGPGDAEKLALLTVVGTQGSGGDAGDGARGERGQHLLQGSHEVQLERGE
ncbi:hypothetical protein [Streptomyces sp. NPDC127098]|uniref:MmyB family transcriptional regulator n=1 Tax=Streptomyces sp. NPDC127098 TaxID=3347137 RepID=UPI003660AAC1